MNLSFDSELESEIKFQHSPSLDDPLLTPFGGGFRLRDIYFCYFLGWCILRHRILHYRNIISHQLPCLTAALAGLPKYECIIKPLTTSMPLLEVIQDDVVSDEKQSCSDENINDGKQLLSAKLSACDEYESEKFHMSDGDLDGIVEITPILDVSIACNEVNGDPMEDDFIDTDMKSITPDESNTLDSLPKETNGSNDANNKGEDRVKTMTVSVPLITNHNK